jgi:4-amino-4-deoxy-L-arabinose transferase-like glycosyltransferase
VGDSGAGLERHVSDGRLPAADTTRPDSTRRALWAPQAIPGLLVMVFALTVLLAYPFRFVFELDPDEGIQLMKALLHAGGQSLYSQIYSDQPPLFTVLLSGLIEVFGAKVLPARMTVLGFSIVLLVSTAEHLRRTWGWMHASAGVVLLVLVPVYMQLSVSVMVGLPAISLAMLSILCLTIWHDGGRPAWLVLAATLLAVSTMIKLFTVVLAPAMVVGLLVMPLPTRDPAGAARRSLRWRPAATWSGVFVGVLAVLVLVWVGPSNLGQLVETHLGVQEITYFARETLLRHARDLWPLFLLAAIGAGVCVYRKVWVSLYFAGWVVLAGVLLAVNTPVWYHQQLLLAVPACVLAGVGLVEPVRLAFGREGKRWALSLLAVMALGLAATYVIWAVPRFVGKLRPDLPNLAEVTSLDAREYDLLTLIEYFDPGGSLLITDRPMFAFRSRRDLPPVLANLSQKVMRSGVVTEQQLIEMIRDSHAPVVLLARFDLPEVEAYLKARYDQVYGYVDLRLFVIP